MFMRATLGFEQETMREGRAQHCRAATFEPEIDN
jgi:hypothetical protein